MPERSPLVRFMLESVQLERFKATFRPDPLTFSPFTVLIGRNGSGKSTVLEAIQWLDTALRHDAVRACERYSGIRDLINIRGRGEASRYFKIVLRWKATTGGRKHSEQNVTYEIRVNESADGRPLIHSEQLAVDSSGGQRMLIRTAEEGDRTTAGTRVLFPDDKVRERVFDEPDRLALSRVVPTAEANGADQWIAALRDFWQRAVFLRLSPHRLVQGSLPSRRSFDPLLDEEGQSLPALIHELSPSQRTSLIRAMNTALPDIKKIAVSDGGTSRDQNVFWSVRENFPTGHAGKGTYEIPASMLSEGTRRLTAILALLIRTPPPSLLCIEEIENGLDPWTVLDVMERLRASAANESQVVVTTHSPWLLDAVDVDAIRLVQRKGGNTRYRTFRSVKQVPAFQANVPAGARYVNLNDGGDE